MKKLKGFLVALLFLLFGLASFYFLASPKSVYAIPSNFFKKTIVTGLNNPVDFVQTPDGRIFIAEKSAAIKVVQNGQLIEQPLLCGNENNGCPVKLDVTSFQERGLLGITLDPDFTNNHFFYVIYTNRTPYEYHVSRFTEANNQAVAGSEVVLMKLAANQNAGTHLGGGLRVGMDGKLWFTIGDNTLNAEQEPQKLTSPFGKLHRINLDGTIPADNPFVGQNGVVESIWAYGLRNPFRFDFLPDGRPIIGDVGGDVAEEVNIGVRGGNFGWPLCEGSCSQQGFVNPTFSYPHTGESSASISGGILYTGSMFPQEYKNKYIYGDFVRGYIHTLDFNGTTLINDQEFESDAGAVLTFRQGNDGSLYYLDIFPDGALYQIIHSTDNQMPEAHASADPNSGDAPLTVQFSSQGSSDPEGTTLSYKWDFGDGSTSTDQNPQHIYQTKGNYSAKLIVNDGKIDSAPSNVNIFVGSHAPEVTILTPTEGTKYNAGDTINFSASATDKEDGDLPASAFSWTIVFHHETHTHPFQGPLTNIKSGSFKIPDTGESSPLVWYRINLTVTDSTGLKTTVSRDVFPNKAKITVNSDPVSNLVVNIEGIPFATPYTFETVVGYNLGVEAQTPLDREGQTYDFDHWSDNGEKFHKFKVPAGETSLTVFYKSAVNGNKVAANTIVVGDVKVEGTQLYDDDPKTGLVVLLEQDSAVDATWGATYLSNPDLATAEGNLAGVVDALKSSGCEGGCNDVKVIKWPSEKPAERIYQLSAGQTATVEKNSVVIGDVKINDESQFDDVPESGLLVLMEESGKVEAPWGAMVIRNESTEEAEKTLQNQAAELKDSGCVGGCQIITTLRWPSEKPFNKILELKPGEKKTLPRYAVISGDIKINSKELYDNVETTGLVTRMDSEGEVEAPWGATYNLNNDDLSATIAVDQLEMRVKDRGCLSGCANVSVLNWPAEMMQKAIGLVENFLQG